MPKFTNQTLNRVANAIAGPILEEGQQEVGLGDVVHGFTHRIGAKHCVKCEKKKGNLNRKMSFGRPR